MVTSPRSGSATGRERSGSRCTTAICSATRTYYKFWIDIHPGNPGPEYKAEIYPDSDVLHLMRVANFASGGIKFDCEGLSGFGVTDHESYAKVVIPRDCISIPPSVRVAVVGYYDEDSDPAIDVVDWAPGEERFYPWVNR